MTGGRLYDQYWRDEMNHKGTSDYYQSLKRIVGDYIEKKHRVEPFTGKATELNILEIGTGWGISGHMFLEFMAVKHLTTVDKAITDKAKGLIGLCNRNQDVTFSELGSDGYFASIEKKPQFDIIFVDGDHRYFQDKVDEENAWAVLNSGGLMMKHDVMHDGNFQEGSDYGGLKASIEFLRNHEVKPPVCIWPIYPGILYYTKP